MTLPGYDDPDLSVRLERFAPATLDRLGFAVVRVDAAGVVRVLNRAAAALPLFEAEDALGRDFFEEVAPALAGSTVRGLIERALDRGAIDLEFGHGTHISDPLLGLRGRMQPARGGGFWMFLAPD